MKRSHFRLWGSIDWTLSKLNVEKWDLIGASSAEDRCMATLNYRRMSISRCRLLEIRDPDPEDEGALIRKLEERANAFQKIGVGERELSTVQLMASLDDVKQEIEPFLDGSAPNVLLDISTMPKRWFFALVRMLLQSPAVESVVVAYTSAAQYAPLLAENPEPVLVLPGYYADDGRSEHDDIIIGIGFEPLGLSSLINEMRAERLRLIFPFPPGPPGFARNWMFVKQIEDMTEDGELTHQDCMHIHMYDCSQVFDALVRMTDGGVRTCALAPYGPKPMSLAMCLYSLAVADSGKPRAPVYYAQPRRYALNYSSGVRLTNGVPDIQCYCIKWKSKPIYTLT